MTHNQDTPSRLSHHLGAADSGTVDSVINDAGAADEHSAQESSEDELKALRQLLLGGDLEELFNPPLNLETLAQMLPEAMARASFQQEKLTDAAVPTVESAIQSSIQRDSNVLSDVLFPVIGPATRKSIASAIGNLVQSLNQTLEYSLSPQSFKWRLEARRTGKSFAEVVLLRTLVYQVEQVFLIHRETGLVLQHIVAERAAAQDPDLVSAMLTALEDFVKDSFAVEAAGSLDTLEIKDFTLWIEEGPQAILACVIRGTAPQSLREILQASQEKIHLLFRSSLEAFEGDATVLDGARPYLEDCFQSQFKEQLAKNKRTQLPFSQTQKKLAVAVVICLGVALMVWGFLSGQAHQRWEGYVAQVSQQPGLVVISHGKQRSGQYFGLWRDRYFITGLRDPLAADPAALLAAAELSPDRIEMSWEPYFSLLPDLMGKRIEALTHPPKTVSWRFDKAGVVHLAGSAPAEWIHSARQLSTRLYGLAGWEDSALLSDEQTGIDRLIDQIESRSFEFASGRSDLGKASAALREAQARDIRVLGKAAGQLGQTVRIKLLGEGEGYWGSAHSLWLGQERADALKRSLLSDSPQNGSQNDPQNDARNSAGTVVFEAHALEKPRARRRSDAGKTVKRQAKRQTKHRENQVTFNVELIPER